MGAGSGGSAMLALKAEPMLGRDFDPLFKLEHMLKDVRHCLDEARTLGVAMPLGTTAEHLYTQADRHGRGSQDFAAVITALEQPDT
jgi:3-hydroxyisobutyrate dehydrogenase-like beta-hydroxyacid dehydrogenase